MNKTKRQKNNRVSEILKAQGKIGKEIIEKSQQENKIVENEFELPIKAIKKDLLKTTIFAFVSIATIIALGIYNVNFDTLKWLFKF